MTMAEARKREIQITISEDCNLDCVYCYERKKSHKSISLPLARKIIADELSAPGLEEAVSYFHGGEIALHFELIKDICDWVWEQDTGGIRKAMKKSRKECYILISWR